MSAPTSGAEAMIFGYNGLGRVAGETGGPGGGGSGGGGTMFVGATGPFRLLQSGLGDQAGWLLGFAPVVGVGLIALTRLRRRGPRTGWLIAVGGAFTTTAVTFSFASGIFHPYTDRESVCDQRRCNGLPSGDDHDQRRDEREHVRLPGPSSCDSQCFAKQLSGRRVKAQV